MLTVSEDARKELEAYFDGKEKKTIRLWIIRCG